MYEKCKKKNCMKLSRGLFSLLKPLKLILFWFYHFGIFGKKRQEKGCQLYFLPWVLETLASHIFIYLFTSRSRGTKDVTLSFTLMRSSDNTVYLCIYLFIYLCISFLWDGLEDKILFHNLTLYSILAWPCILASMEYQTINFYTHQSL